MRASKTALNPRDPRGRGRFKVGDDVFVGGTPDQARYPWRVKQIRHDRNRALVVPNSSEPLSVEQAKPVWVKISALHPVPLKKRFPPDHITAGMLGLTAETPDSLKPGDVVMEVGTRYSQPMTVASADNTKHEAVCVWFRLGMQFDYEDVHSATFKYNRLTVVTPEGLLAWKRAQVAGTAALLKEERRAPTNEEMAEALAALDAEITGNNCSVDAQRKNIGDMQRRLAIGKTNEWSNQLAQIIREIRESGYEARCEAANPRFIATTRIVEALTWLGMDLNNLEGTADRPVTVRTSS